VNPAYRFGVKLADSPASYYGEVLRMRPGEVLRPIGKGALGGALAGGVYDLWKQHGREGDFDYKQLAKHMGVGGAIGAGIGAIPGARRGHEIAKEQSILDKTGPFSAQVSFLDTGPLYSLNGQRAAREDVVPYADNMIRAARDPAYMNPGESLRVGTRGVISVHGSASAPEEKRLTSIVNAPRDPAERSRWVAQRRYDVMGHSTEHNIAADAANPLHVWDGVSPDDEKAWRHLIDSLV